MSVDSLDSVSLNHFTLSIGFCYNSVLVLLSEQTAVVRLI